MVALVGHLIQVEASYVDVPSTFSPDACLSRSSHLQKAISFTVWDQSHLMLGQQAGLLQAMFDDAPPLQSVSEDYGL